MEIFDEVKNRYFHIIFRVLNESIKGMSKEEILKILDEEEFQEKVIGKDQQTFAGLLLNEYEEEENYNLMKEKEGKFYPAIEANKNLSLPVRFTSIEKAWLKALIEEPSVKNMLSESTKTKLAEILKDVDTPIASDIIEVTNAAKLPQIDDTEEYEKNFRTLLKAIIEHKTVRYCNVDRNGNKYCDKLSIPIRLEYSMRDGRMRVSMYSLDDNRSVMSNVHSLSNVEIEEDIKPTMDRETAIKLLRERKYSEEPLVLEVTDIKNAMERCFMSFSGLERSSKCIGEDKYEIKLSYYVFDEEEVIRKVLALGPYVKVISPSRIAEEVVKRIRKAIEMAEKDMINFEIESAV